ncbi:MAG TPA: hypothetical protein VHZ28_13165 [Terracidiphilus sp.]|jgi:hypothetical protein|nr:hypothetical protein [Terracidiphilus sp.]
MNRLLSCAVILASLSIPAFAAKNSQSITVTDPIKVGSTQLAAGSYTVSWTGAAPNVQLTIQARGKAPVTVPAKLMDAKNGHVALLTNTVGGALVLESIQLDKVSLVLTGATAAGE